MPASDLRIDVQSIPPSGRTLSTHCTAVVYLHGRGFVGRGRTPELAIECALRAYRDRLHAELEDVVVLLRGLR